MPAEWVALASRLAADAGMAMRADICLINWYGDDGRMGLHQDKDESRESIDAGVPVVSVSLGDTARFLFGGTRRRDPVESFLLESGDVFVFGGPSRLRYHGVTRIIPGTAPARARARRAIQSHVPAVLTERSGRSSDRPGGAAR